MEDEGKYAGSVNDRLISMSSAPRGVGGGDLVEEEEERYNCNYCDATGMNEISYVEHVLDNHPSDPQRVTCPICLAKNGGVERDMPKYSLDFPSHLELR